MKQTTDHSRRYTPCVRHGEATSKELPSIFHLVIVNKSWILHPYHDKKDCSRLIHFICGDGIVCFQQHGRLQ